MIESVDNIQAGVRKMQQLEHDEKSLFIAINELPVEDIEALVDQYVHVVENFRPVNLLRYEAANLLKSGKKLDKAILEDLKNRIRHRDADYFQKYGNKLVETLKAYPQKKIDLFTVWKNPYRILYGFIYRGRFKEEIELALRELEKQIREKLDLKGFLSNTVSFEGTANFGSSYCWMAFYPQSKLNHQRAYQLFLQLNGKDIDAGVMPGWKIDDSESKDVRSFHDIEKAIEHLATVKTRASELNANLHDHWKVAPGPGASNWDEFYRDGIMAINWSDSDLGDLTQYRTSEELGEALGVEDVQKSNTIYEIENFRDAAIGDTVIANRGRKEAVGVGVIEGVYEYHPEKLDFRHVRRVKWYINKSVAVEKPFRPDAFSATKEYDEIKRLYVEKYPDLAKTFAAIERRDLPPLPPPPTDTNFWWINANPKYWNILEYGIGQEQSYTTHNEDGNKRRVFEYFKAVRPGDVVLGYQTSPEQKIVAVFEILKPIHNSEEGEVISFTVKELLPEPVSYSELKDRPELENCEVMLNHQGSLFKLTAQEYETIRSIISEKNPRPQEPKTPRYEYEQAFGESNLLHDEFKKYHALLQSKKQIILQGPPGTGKTYLADIFRKLLTQNERERSEVVQFHPSYSYEDFVQGYRPIEGGGFTLRDGVFKDICRRATILRDKPFVLMIDEINRGNLSKVFGELLYLLEYRKEKIKLTYSPDIDFRVPENLYVIGTMNTADRSLALVDYALRRRFSFIRLTPSYHVIKKLLLEGKSPINVDRLVSNLESVNRYIAQIPSLGQGFEIGHSFFLKKIPFAAEDLSLVFEYELEPLLQEYFFDSPEQVDKVKAMLFEGLLP